MPKEAAPVGSQNLVGHRKLVAGNALEVAMPLANRTVSGC